VKILHTVENYWPAGGGMAEAVRQVSERLVARGHDLTVATRVHPDRSTYRLNGVAIAEFDVSGNLAKGLCGEVDHYRDFVRRGNFQVVTNFAAQQWATDALFDDFAALSAAKVFVPTGFSGLYWNEYRDYYARMPGWLRQYDRLVVLGEACRDARFARDCGMDHLVVIPNGAAAEEFLPEATIDIRARLGIPTMHGLILHVGSHTGLKGHAEAIRMFARAGLHRATLLLVGDGLSTRCGIACRRLATRFRLDPRQVLRSKRLVLTELNRAETVAAFQAADLFLFPSMIECSPIVLFECLAARAPFLATDAGNTREILDWAPAGEILPGHHSDDGLVHAHVEEGATLLAQLYADRDRRATMAEKGFAAWQQRFTWEKVAEQYEHLYRDLRGEGDGV
jgi:glycosyltransferase involved in cell wall biosynthesis